MYPSSSKFRILINMGAYESFAHKESDREQNHAYRKNCKGDEIEFHIFFLLLRCKVSARCLMRKGPRRIFRRYPHF